MKTHRYRFKKGHTDRLVLNRRFQLYTCNSIIRVGAHVGNKSILKDEEPGAKTFHQATALQRPYDRIAAGHSLFSFLNS